MALTSPPSPRRERWPWLPVLFLKSKARPVAPPAPEPRSAVDTEARDLLRLIAGALPHCVAAGTGARTELEDISDRLEALAGGEPEQAWAEALANDFSTRSRDDVPSAKVRVSWGSDYPMNTA